MFRRFFTFRSGREKNIFIIITLVILIVFTTMIVLINQTQALINDISQVPSPSITSDQTHLTKKAESNQNDKEVLSSDDNEMMAEVKITGEIGQAKHPSFINLNLAAAADKNVRQFTVVGSNGILIPRLINVNVDDVVVLDFTALDDDYDFILDGHYLNQSCKQGENSRIVFQVIDEGEFYYYCSSCPDIMASAGQLVVN